MDPFFDIAMIIALEYPKTKDFKARMNRAQEFLLQEIEESGGQAP